MSKGLHINQLGLDNGATSPTEEGHVVMKNGEIEFHDGTGVVTLSADVSTNTTSITTNSNNITALSAGKVNKDECETCTFGLGNITLSGEQTLNGVLTSGSRVIVVEQTADADNGIYVTAVGAWTRATDFDLAAEMVSGSRTMVLNPASDCYRDTFVMYSDDVVTVDTDPVLFTRIPALDFGTTAGTAAEGNDSRFHDPVTLAGSPNYLTLVGQVLTRALIDLTSHVTGILPVLNGGTGASTVGGAQTALGIKPNALEATDIDTFAELDAIVTDATLAKTTDLHDAVTLNAGAVTQESANLSGQEIELVTSTTTTAGVMSAADKLKLDNIATGANNYTHPNHTGEVTSVADGAQTLDPTAITNKTAVNVDGADYVLISDDSDAGNLKKVLASEFLGGGSPSDHSALVMERTTDKALTGTPDPITFDVTGTENNPAELEHNNTNTERAEIKTTGLHQVTVSLTATNTGAQTRTLGLDLGISGTPVKTISIDLAKTETDTFTRITQVELTAGTYLTASAYQVGGGSDLTIEGTTILTLVKQSGTTGPTGPTGPTGAGSNIIGQDEGVTQGTVIDTLNFVGAGVTLTEAAGVGTVTIPGGGGGGGGTYIQCTKDNGNPEGTSSTSYITVGRKWIYEGGAGFASPKVIIYRDGTATSAEARIYDITNAQEICTVSTTSMSLDNIETMGSVSGLPGTDAVFEVQVKRTGGSGNANIFGVLLR